MQPQINPDVVMGGVEPSSKERWTELTETIQRYLLIGHPSIGDSSMGHASNPDLHVVRSAAFEEVMNACAAYREHPLRTGLFPATGALRDRQSLSFLARFAGPPTVSDVIEQIQSDAVATVMLAADTDYEELKAYATARSEGSSALKSHLKDLGTLDMRRTKLVKLYRLGISCLEEGQFRNSAEDSDVIAAREAIQQWTTKIDDKNGDLAYIQAAVEEDYQEHKWHDLEERWTKKYLPIITTLAETQVMLKLVKKATEILSDGSDGGIIAASASIPTLINRCHNDINGYQKLWDASLAYNKTALDELVSEVPWLSSALGRPDPSISSDGADILAIALSCFETVPTLENTPTLDQLVRDYTQSCFNTDIEVNDTDVQGSFTAALGWVKNLTETAQMAQVGNDIVRWAQKFETSHSGMNQDDLDGHLEAEHIDPDRFNAAADNALAAAAKAYLRTITL